MGEWPSRRWSRISRPRCARLPVFPAASRELAPYVLVLSVARVLYGPPLAIDRFE